MISVLAEPDVLKLLARISNALWPSPPVPHPGATIAPRAAEVKCAGRTRSGIGKALGAERAGVLQLVMRAWMILVWPELRGPVRSRRPATPRAHARGGRRPPAMSWP